MDNRRPHSPSQKRILFGSRSPPNTADPGHLLVQLQDCTSELEKTSEKTVSGINELRSMFANSLRIYYTLAAVARRRTLANESRTVLTSQLFGLRRAIELRIRDCLLRSFSPDDIVKLCAVDSFFGTTVKQGVSVRYALASCVPTTTCKGACYAHDGHDRDGFVVLRGTFNWTLGSMYEDAGRPRRAKIMNGLNRPIGKAIAHALGEAAAAANMGYIRDPRIRLSHVGEMASTPTFTNALAAAIRRVCPEVKCVVYTRHPKARELDAALIAVNFTIESDADTRRKFAPPTARIVASSWGGVLATTATVNFLEHHGSVHATPSDDEAFVCPVTASHRLTSCDEARCDVCFCRPKP